MINTLDFFGPTLQQNTSTSTIPVYEGTPGHGFDTSIQDPSTINNRWPITETHQFTSATIHPPTEYIYNFHTPGHGFDTSNNIEVHFGSSKTF